jgi:Ca2+-binding RTX toxin-like protein
MLLPRPPARLPHAAKLEFSSKDRSRKGGAGHFYFYGPNEGADRIMDFNVADDQVCFSRGFGVPAGTLAQAGVSFVLGGAATIANETVAYNTGNGNLYWDDDGTGGHAAVLLAIFVNKPTLTANDFFIV